MNASFPQRIKIEGGEVELRAMRAADDAAVLAFAQALPANDLLFLRRDIRQPKVVAAWLREIDAGQFETVLAWQGDTVVGCGTVVRDRLSWSAHVAELRAVIAQSLRGRGLGTQLVQQIFRAAIVGGAEKIFAQMTTDQSAAIALFEGFGFRPEAILRNHVRGLDGVDHDIVVLCQNVANAEAKLEAYGLAADFDIA
jgi:L-amino acid N-acyltransferase YncA